MMLTQQDALYKTWKMCGILYTFSMLQNSCTVGYLLPNVETL
jgi:hypothetical protein